MPRHCYVLSVFTRDGQGGNPLGVVTDILGLDDAKMQRVATDLGFSETIFLHWFEGSAPKARIFTPRREIPFAGHPLVGAAWVLLNLGPLNPDEINCSIGPIKIRQDGDLTWIETPPGQPVMPLPPARGVKAIETLEVRVPSPYTLILLGSVDEIASMTPDALSGLGDVYIWTWQKETATVRARFFAPDFGIEEDAATGSAAVALGARMRYAGIPEGSLTIYQGEEMGIPSKLHLEWNPLRTSVGGTVTKDEVRFLKI